MKLLCALLLVAAAVMAEKPIRIVFAHADAQHIEWDLKRHLDTAFHHANLQDVVVMTMWQKPTPRLVLAFPPTRQKDVWCALRTSDAQANYWTSSLQWNDVTETYVLHERPNGSLLGHKLNMHGEYKGQSWRDVLDVAMREVSAWECAK
jgi:hypothetical protein